MLFRSQKRDKMRNEGSVTLQTRMTGAVGGSYGNNSLVEVDWPQQNMLMSNQLSIIQQHNSCVPKDTVDGMLEERDTIWRAHERSQISFLQQEHANMLQSLHQEINKLQQKCTEAMTDQMDREERRRGRSEERRVVDKEYYDAHVQDLNKKLHKANTDMEAMRQLILTKIQRIESLEEKLVDTENRLRDDQQTNGTKMSDLQEELRQKSALISQLSSQVHQLKLREAVDKHNLRSISIPRPTTTTSYTSPTKSTRSVHLPSIMSRPNSVLATTVTVQPKPLHPAPSRYVRFESRAVPRSQSAVLPAIEHQQPLGIEKQSSADQLQRNQLRSSFKKAKRLSQDGQYDQA